MILYSKHPNYDLTKWIKIITATIAFHNFIRDTHRKDSDFVHWQGTEDYHEHSNSEEYEDDDSDSDDDGGSGLSGYTPYEPTGDKVLENLRDNITIELGRGGCLPYGEFLFWEICFILWHFSV